jgi:hypothetical protein
VRVGFRHALAEVQQRALVADQQVEFAVARVVDRRDHRIARVGCGRLAVRVAEHDVPLSLPLP